MATLWGLLAALLVGADSVAPKRAAAAGAALPTALLPAPLPSGSPAGQVPIHLLRQPGNGLLPVVAVRIDGHGPYPFVLDTGAASSVIGPALAHQFRLPSTTALDHQAKGAACGQAPSGGTTPRVELSSWQVGGVKLPATAVVALAGFGSGTSTIDGLLGSDALSGLSALTINYRTARATLGPASTKTAGRRVPLVLGRDMGEVAPIAPVTIGTHHFSFVVDTGASISAVTPSLTSQLHLPVVQTGHGVAGSTCSAKVNVVALQHWDVGTVALPLERVTSLTLPYKGLPTPINLVTGLVGEDVLASFGTITIDYAHHCLVLG